MLDPALAFPTAVVLLASLLAIVAVIASPIIASTRPDAALAVVGVASLAAAVGGPTALFWGQSLYATAPLGAPLITIYGSLGILAVVAVGVTFAAGAVFQIRDELPASRWTQRTRSMPPVRVNSFRDI